MKKTLKTFINTGLFMLFVCHSHGLALVYNLPDVNFVQGPPQYTTNTAFILTNWTNPEFNGIDDTFDGSITFEITFQLDVFPTGLDNYALFQLWNGQTEVPIGIGIDSSDIWLGYRFDDKANGLNIGNTPIVGGQSQSFTLTIDYNAGALDTALIVVDGDSNVYNIGDYDYSFDIVALITGTDHAGSLTNITVSIVPEPETYALIFGALAFVFVALRRRLKA